MSRRASFTLAVLAAVVAVVAVAILPKAARLAQTTAAISAITHVDAFSVHDADGSRFHPTPEQLDHAVEVNEKEAERMRARRNGKYVSGY